MTNNERDWRLSIEMVKACRAWKNAQPGHISETMQLSFVAGYKAALENHADCHPADDIDMCQQAVKEGARE